MGWALSPVRDRKGQRHTVSLVGGVLNRKPEANAQKNKFLDGMSRHRGGSQREKGRGCLSPPGALQALEQRCAQGERATGRAVVR